MNNPQPWWLTWPVAEVAATILPLFSFSFPDAYQRHQMGSPYQWDRLARASIVNWFKTGSYTSTARGMNTVPFADPDHRAVIEAMQVLEHAGLLVRGDYEERTFIGLTRLGEHALQTNTVRQHLGLGNAPPTA
jgi:hypothetical protein